MRSQPITEDVEIQILLDAVYARYGYDFRDYSRAHVKRRIRHRLQTEKIESISIMQQKLLNDPEFSLVLFKDLSINVTEMFRDPAFYKAVREQVVVLLKTWSFVRIWHAGCSTGEEVYSMAILLKEEGLYERTQIYATDFNESVLQHAKEGIFSLENMKRYAENYQRSGAKASFSDYYTAMYDGAIIDQSLKKNIVWGNHNLVTDSDFAEMHLIVCRNVMIYFNASLQSRVYGLFHKSMVNGGVLCLGGKENIRNNEHCHHFETINDKQRIYKKKYMI